MPPPENRPYIVVKPLATAHLIAAASPDYLRGRPLPASHVDIAAMDSIAMRSLRTGRIAPRLMRNASGEEQATLLGLGVTLIVKAYTLPQLESKELVRDCCRHGGSMRGRYRSTTPAETSSPRKRGCSLTSWSRCFSVRDIRNGSRGAWVRRRQRHLGGGDGERTTLKIS